MKNYPNKSRNCLTITLIYKILIVSQIANYQDKVNLGYKGNMDK